MIRLALRSALSDRAASDRVALVDTFGWETPRTKDAVAALSALELHDRVLVVLGPDDVVAERSFGNLPAVQTVELGELSAHDVVRNDWILFTDETLDAVNGAERADVEDTEATEAEAEVEVEVVATPATPATDADAVAEIEAEATPADDEAAADNDVEDEA
jgi:large subunit ribosomal protein L4